MFEAKLLDGSILKRIVEAIKDVVNDVNIDVSPSGKQSIWPTLRLDSSDAIAYCTGLRNDLSFCAQFDFDTNEVTHTMIFSLF